MNGISVSVVVVVVQGLLATVVTLILNIIIIMDSHGWSESAQLELSLGLICDGIPIGATPGQLSRYGIMCLSRRASTPSIPDGRRPGCVIDSHKIHMATLVNISGSSRGNDMRPTVTVLPQDACGGEQRKSLQLASLPRFGEGGPCGKPRGLSGTPGAPGSEISNVVFTTQTFPRVRKSPGAPSQLLFYCHFREIA